MGKNSDGDEGVRIGNGRVVRETEKALLLDLDDWGEKWVPKSQVHPDSEVFDMDVHDRGEVVIKKWFADKEGYS